MALFLVGAAGCAARHLETAEPVATIHSSVVWRLSEGDVVRTRVYRQPELSADAPVTANGSAFFAGVGRVQVTGLSLDSLEVLLNQRYTAIVREPAVQVTMLREVSLLGQVRAPGVYAIDPSTTILALIAKAGGPTNATGTPAVSLLRADGRRFRLPNEARLGTVELERADAVQISDDSFFVRNQSSIGATQLIVTTLSTLVSVILIVTR